MIPQLLVIFQSTFDIEKNVFFPRFYFDFGTDFPWKRKPLAATLTLQGGLSAASEIEAHI